ncbi:hypothetical protein TNCV_4730831 [Trichonephila clavipes]|nr:hypothetical protein TNCV_4730831 [Trichonephila clavipes]
MTCDAEGYGFQMLNDDEIVTSVPEESDPVDKETDEDEGNNYNKTATAGSDGVQSGRPIFDDFFQHLWPYIGNNTVNVVFQMVTRLWLIRIDQ